jgi:hypothetical protein
MSQFKGAPLPSEAVSHLPSAFTEDSADSNDPVPTGEWAREKAVISFEFLARS